MSRLVGWRRVAGRSFPDVSIDHTASSFRTRHPSASLFHYPLDEGNIRLRNMRDRLRKKAALLAAVPHSAAVKLSRTPYLNSNGPLAIEQTISDQAFWYVTPYSFIRVPHLFFCCNSWTSNTRRLMPAVCRLIGRPTDRNSRSYHNSVQKEKYNNLRDFGLPPWSGWVLCPSGWLRSQQ